MIAAAANLIVALKNKRSNTDSAGAPLYEKIIPRAEHPISRKNIDKDALRVMQRLNKHGHEAYLVGGAVRDLYIGKTPKDYDILLAGKWATEWCRNQATHFHCTLGNIRGLLKL